MTVDSSRTLDNATDVGRKVPSTSVSPRLLTELKGVFPESITGPDAVGAAPANVVTLSHPAEEIVAILSTVTASGAAGAILRPIEGTHYNLANNSQGVAELTNPSAVDFTTETWLVLYRRQTRDRDFGGQSTVSP